MMYRATRSTAAPSSGSTRTLVCTENPVCLHDSSSSRSGGELTVRPFTADPPATARGSVAVVEDGLVTRVRRGENADRELRHQRVVRAFTEARLRDATGAGIRLRPPDGLDRSRAEIVAWLTQGRGGRVLAAAAAPLP